MRILRIFESFVIRLKQLIKLSFQHFYIHIKAKIPIENRQ